jgi:FixJ family two-component response regulator
MSFAGGVVAIVDDDPFILRALTRALTAYGYRVRAFASAELYLGRAGTDEISCVVIDVDLGRGKTGLDLGRAIAASENPTPIVFMSALKDPHVLARAEEIGCVDFLVKPFLTERLVGIIMRLEGQDPNVGESPV